MKSQTITDIFLKKHHFLLVSSKSSRIFAFVKSGLQNENLHSMTDRIRHKGIVDSIEGKCARVRILQTSACSTCKVASRCNASESKEKIVDVADISQHGSLAVGDEVVVSTSTSAVRRALMIGFGLPFVVMVAALLIAMGVTADETLSALIAMASLVVYYLIIYMVRDRLGRGVTFEIE